MVISPNPMFGTGLHALGGISASTCYLPYQKIKRWSWGSYWLLQATFAWLIFPLVIGYLTVPDLFVVFTQSPRSAILWAFGLGIIYGFGGMAFGLAIREIGYSLTYTIAIGISAVLGTVVPLMVDGMLVTHFSKSGGTVMLLGMLISLLGVALCGIAGYRKEREINSDAVDRSDAQAVPYFNMRRGLVLTIFAGTLSAIFGISLAFGEPVAAIAADYGAGHFNGNANLILSTGGAFVTNFIWFLVLGIRNGSIKELIDVQSQNLPTWWRNVTLSVLSGGLWYFQFFFYGLGHVRMGAFMFTSWAIHMAMLIFFSYVVGIIMKEWKQVSRRTYLTLVLALVVLVLSFVIMTYGNVMGNQI